MAAIIFYRSNHTFMGRLVGWVTGSKWSHCGIKHEIQGKLVYTHPIGDHGVYCVLASEYEEPDDTFELPGITNEWATGWCMEKWGKNYGFFEIARWLIKPLRRFKPDSGYTCSEFAGSMLVAASLSQECVLDGEIARRVAEVRGDDLSLLSPADIRYLLYGARE